MARYPVGYPGTPHQLHSVPHADIPNEGSGDVWKDAESAKPGSHSHSGLHVNAGAHPAKVLYDPRSDAVFGASHFTNSAPCGILYTGELAKSVNESEGSDSGRVREPDDGALYRGESSHIQFRPISIESDHAGPDTAVTEHTSEDS